LTGKSGRKPAPLQFHQAYSVRFFQPKGSLLREEVGKLWNKREEKSTINLLTPFTTNGNLDSYLPFHAAVMRWKCSSLTDEERQETQDWIDQKVLEKEEGMKRPWSVANDVGEDELAAENKYIQR